VGAVMSEKLVLRLNDATDLLMAGIDTAAVPVHQPPGRALRVSDSVEMQLALLEDGAGGAAQAAALDALAGAGTATRDASGGQISASHRAPFRVDALPTRVALLTLLGDTTGTPSAQSRHGRQHPAPLPPGVLGVGGDHNDAVGSPRLGHGGNALVAGPPRSGRSTALQTLAVQLLAAGRPVVVLTARRSPLSDLAEAEQAAPGRRRVTVAPEVDIPGSARASTAAGPLALLGPSDDEALAALAVAHPDLVAVVDDAELFLDTPVERPLLQVARRAEASGGGVLCAGTTAELASMFRGLTVEVRKHRLGVLLHPGGHGDGDLFGIRVPSGGELVPGRGLFVDGVDVTPVQVAFPG